MPTPRILLLGANGQVGWELQRALPPLGPVIAIQRKELDLTDLGAVRRMVQEVRPEILVNAAAYTAVDRAESEPESAAVLNAELPGLLAEETRRSGGLFVHYSTDYVYDGRKNEPYLETDTTNPLSVYGRTKLAGDQAVEEAGGAYLIFRTSWVYGARGKNFLLTMLRLFREREEVRVVDDQLGSPTWSRWIAEVTAQAVTRSGRLRDEQRGRLYHLSGGGETTWYGFAQAILQQAREKGRGDLRMRSLVPITTAEYPTPAVRPASSRLSTERLSSELGVAVTPWEQQLVLCMSDLYATHGLSIGG